MRPESQAGMLTRVAAACALAAALPASPGPTQAPASRSSLDTMLLARGVGILAQGARPGVLGVAIKDFGSGEVWSLDGERRFPMQSAFKAPLGAAVLAAVDARRLELSRTITLTHGDLSPPYSPISAAFPGRDRYTVEELLVRAAGGSDNTAADVLMRLVGGPATVTRWLEDKGVGGLRIDRYEREFQIQLNAMPAFRPEWAREEAFLAARNVVPPEARRRATLAYLADSRDTSTPLGAVRFLEKLLTGELLSPESTERLLRILTETTTGARRLKAGLPEGAVLAHKTGTAGADLGLIPAVNDIGIATLAGGRRIVVAVFLSGTTLTYQQADSIHAEVMRTAVRALR